MRFLLFSALLSTHSVTQMTRGWGLPCFLILALRSCTLAVILIMHVVEVSSSRLFVEATKAQ